jgi:hypothetical protein
LSHNPVLVLEELSEVNDIYPNRKYKRHQKMKLTALLAATITLTSTAPHHAFIAPLPFREKVSSSLEMATRNSSMKEKRKQRQAKQRGQQFENPFAGLPKSQFASQQSAVPKALDTPEKIFSPTDAAKKAQELLKAQRASVDMLTKVRERVEGLPSKTIMASLQSQGYFIVDNFLEDENFLAQLEAESISLYQAGEMEVDLANLGSGEYTTAVKGGQTQYAKCPRLVELTVSSTKHLPKQITEPSLDPSACMAVLRTFDRKAFQASLNLLIGSEVVPEANKSFATVVTDPSKDKRRISLQYFFVPESWDSSCGGSITFESGDTVHAKRDRLLMWKSESTSLRKDMWEGNDDFPLASCLELHLLGYEAE